VTESATQQVGLIGWPVEHSVSPAMHNAAFRALGLRWRYTLLPTPPGTLQAMLATVRAQGYRGANLTIPHKRAVMAYLDGVSDGARAMGAVNTLTLRMGRLHGYNTDADGFVRALRQVGFDPVEGRRAVVVGAGGAARAVVYGLLQAGMGEVLVLNRTVTRSRALVSELRGLGAGSGRLGALPLSAEALVESARAADLLVNATPLGMAPDAEGSIWPAEVPVPAHLAVFDLVYNPMQTKLLQQAQDAGAQATGGLEMLVQQGALAFELWTSETPPVDVMRKAAQAALGPSGR
jgi:shikimate dehydrogenase